MRLHATEICADFSILAPESCAGADAFKVCADADFICARAV